MDKILKEVLKTVTPSAKERKLVKDFEKNVLSVVRKYNPKGEIEGSLAKDTWISGDHDVDVFIFYEEGTKRVTIEEDGIEIGTKIIKELGGEPEIAYAEHPYTKTTIGSFTLDIVPAIQIKKTRNLHTSVDRTPFHTAYVKQKLAEKQHGEVRLLKQFTKGIGAYSAKEKIRGFSGYLCELLILEYGTFKKVVKEAAEWNEELVIDLEKSWKNKKVAHKSFMNPLVVIDPTDKNRNVAAALDVQNFNLFIEASQKFVNTPRAEFFYPNPVKPLSIETLPNELEQYGNIVIIAFEAPSIVEDVIYSQLRRSLNSLQRALKDREFKIKKAAMYVDSNCYFILALKDIELSKTQTLEGPPVTIPLNQQNEFTYKHKEHEPYVKNKRWFVDVPRKNVHVKELIAELLVDPRKIGVGKYIAEKIQEDCKIFVNDELFAQYEDELAGYITQFLSKKKPWEW